MICACKYFLLFHFFFFNDTATTEIYTLSLHDALPICPASRLPRRAAARSPRAPPGHPTRMSRRAPRSEEHTSELQSRRDLVCRLLLEKKKQTIELASGCAIAVCSLVEGIKGGGITGRE